MVYEYVIPEQQENLIKIENQLLFMDRRCISSFIWNTIHHEINQITLHTISRSRLEKVSCY